MTYRIEYNIHKKLYRVTQPRTTYIHSIKYVDWLPVTRTKSFGENTRYYQEDITFATSSQAADWIRNKEAENAALEAIRQLDQWKPI